MLMDGQQGAREDAAQTIPRQIARIRAEEISPTSPHFRTRHRPKTHLMMIVLYSYEYPPSGQGEPPGGQVELM